MSEFGKWTISILLPSAICLGIGIKILHFLYSKPRSKSVIFRFGLSLIAASVGILMFLITAREQSGQVLRSVTNEQIPLYAYVRAALELLALFIPAVFGAIGASLVANVLTRDVGASRTRKLGTNK